MTAAELDSWDELSWPGNLTPVTAANLQQSGVESTALPFIVTVDDQPSSSKYWVKALEGPEGPFALIAEAIVSGLGKLTGAPVCDTAFIDISAFTDRMIAPGHPSQYRLSHPVAYGSRDIPGATSSPVIRNRTVGDNPARLAYEYVLFEWCLGGDEQWLTDPADRRLYSHDHGRWLITTTGQLQGPPTWSASALDAMLDTQRGSYQHKIATASSDVRQAAVQAGRITHNDLVNVLDPIVAAWGGAGIIFPDGLSLEATMRRVGRWLEKRRDIVTARLGS